MIYLERKTKRKNMSDYKPIHKETYVPFVFNEEEQTVIRDCNITKLMDFLFYYLLTDRNPRLKIALLCYASGFDVGRILDCSNTQRDISKKLNVNHRQFNAMLKTIEIEFGLKNHNVEKPSDFKETLKKTNKV